MRLEDPHHPGRDERPRHGRRYDVEAATDARIFLAYLDRVLCPQLQPGQVVIMDTLSSHKVTGVRERIEACAASVLYLPPTPPTSTRLKKHGANSNSNSVL